MAAVCVRPCSFNKLLFTNFYVRTRPSFQRFFNSNNAFSGRRFRYSNTSLVAVGIGAGALVGAGWSWAKFQEVKPPVLNNAKDKEDPLLPSLPKVRIARKISNPTDSTDLQLVLFQYPTCPFCCKVRAFLDYYGLSYEVVEVDPVLRREISWSEYKKVPILVAKVENGYRQLNDSSMIVSALKSYLHDRSTSLNEIVGFYPTMEFRDDNGYLKNEIMNRYFLMYRDSTSKNLSSETIIEERKWRRWADDSLVHTLSPNVYRTREEAMQAFNWFAEVGEWDRLFPSWERNLIVYVGALAMWGIGKRLKKRHNLKDDVRESLYDECNRWVSALNQKGTPFMGGPSPNLADLAVYGVLSSIEGCTAFQDLLKRTNIGTWYYSLKKTVEANRGTVEKL